MATSNKRNFPFREMKSGEHITFQQSEFGSEYEAFKALTNASIYYKKTYGIELKFDKVGEIFTVTIVNNPKPKRVAAAVPAKKATKGPAPVPRAERSARSVYRDVFVGSLSFGMAPTDAADRAVAAMVLYRNTLEAWRVEDEKRIAP